MMTKGTIGKAAHVSFYALPFLYACIIGLQVFTPIQDLGSRAAIAAVLAGVLTYPAIKAYGAKKLFWLLSATISMLFILLIAFNILFHDKYDPVIAYENTTSLFISGFALLLSFAFYNSKTKKLFKEKKSQISKDHVGSFIQFEGLLNYLVVNTEKKYVLIGSMVNTAFELSYDEILISGEKILQADLDIDDDSVLKTKGSQGHALVGAIAFGAAGAIVGSLGSKTTVERKYIRTIDLKLILDDPKKPFARINLFKTTKGRGELAKSKVMIKEMKRVDEIYSSIVMIMKTAAQA